MELVCKCGGNKNGFPINKPELLKIHKVITKTQGFNPTEAERFSECLFQGGDLKQEKENF